MAVSNFVEVGDARVAYRVNGRGPAIVLVNGTGGLDMYWGSVIAKLAEHRTVITLDYSGAGETTDNGAALSLPGIARQIAAVAKAAGAATFDLVGFSLGAAIAIQLATDAPGSVRSLITAAGFPWGDEPRLKVLFALWRDLAQTNREALIRVLFFHGLTPGFVSSLGYDAMDRLARDYFAVANWEGLKRQIELGASVDIRARAGDVICPTLVLSCTQDQFVPERRALVDLMPGALYGEIDTGHMLFAEAPDEFVAQVNLFLNRLPH